MGNIICKERRMKGTSLTKQTTPSEFRYVDGRRFHNVEGVKYLLPNDDEELDRLHLQHFMIRHFFQSNFSAPVEHVLNSDSKVLDVGCGTGSWMFEVATDYPNAKITGIDISPIQPASIKPKNVSFVLANILTESLPFEDNTFDYIFQRLMIGAIPSDNWPDVIKESTRVLKPGGYLELSEFGLPFKMGPVSTKLMSAFDEILVRRGLDPKIAYRLRSLVEQSGQFEDINEARSKLSYGDELGKLAQAAIDNYKAAFISLKPFALPIVGVTSEEYDEMLDTQNKELKDYNTYADIIRVYGRKRENT